MSNTASGKRTPGAPRAWMAVASRGDVEQNMPKLAVYGGTNYGTKAFDIASSTLRIRSEKRGKLFIISRSSGP